MTEFTSIYAASVAAHLLYSMVFLAGAVLLFAAVDTVRRIRSRYGYIKFAPRYAVAFLTARTARSVR